MQRSDFAASECRLCIARRPHSGGHGGGDEKPQAGQSGGLLVIE
jgi:hypothetical protein